MALPTREQMMAKATAQLEQAYESLNESAAWLMSDWQPLGSTLTAEQAAQRRAMRKAISAAKRELNKVLDQY